MSRQILLIILQLSDGLQTLNTYIYLSLAEIDLDIYVDIDRFNNYVYDISGSNIFVCTYANR